MCTYYGVRLKIGAKHLTVGVKKPSLALNNIPLCMHRGVGVLTYRLVRNLFERDYPCMYFIGQIQIIYFVILNMKDFMHKLKPMRKCLLIEIDEILLLCLLQIMGIVV